jgi:predicted RNA binding protein YcfA (HicA-like mRNA interferase family)
MATPAELIRIILSGQADANIRFSELCGLLKRLGFHEHVRGSHHIFRKPATREKINLQPEGNNAKPYQVRQIRKILVKYGTGDIEI